MIPTHEYYWRFEDDGDNWKGPYKTYNDCLAAIPFAQMMAHEIEVRPTSQMIAPQRDGSMDR